MRTIWEQFGTCIPNSSKLKNYDRKDRKKTQATNISVHMKDSYDTGCIDNGETIRYPHETMHVVCQTKKRSVTLHTVLYK